jgi:hypothetical protein
VSHFLYRNEYVQFWKVDSQGRAAGIVADPEDVDTSNTVTSGALVLPYIIDSAAMGITPAIYTHKSGGRTWDQIDGGVDSLGSFLVNLGAHVETLAQLASGVGYVNVDTGGTLKQGGIDLTAMVLNNMGMAVSVRRSVKVNGVRQTGYRHKIYPLVTIRFGDFVSNQQVGENPIPFAITVTPSMASTAPWGEAFEDISNLNYSDGMTAMHQFDSLYPMHLATSWMDGTDTTYTLPYLPKNADATNNGKNYRTKNGARTAVTSCVTTTGVVTLASAGTEGDMWHDWYEVQANQAGYVAA